MNLFSALFKKKSKKIKIGIALGSGGAKGFAELGVLYAFEQNGIEFDYVAGTSIGSIIGAFLANGYTSTEIFELLRRVEAKDVLGSFAIKLGSSSLFNLIDKNISSLNIEELKKPFAAIATEVERGNEKVFREGNVAKALCASSSYPPFFKPVEIDGVYYKDGAFTNSIPADVVKEMGADYVIGVDLSHSDTITEGLTKILTFKGRDEGEKVKEFVKDVGSEKGYEYADTMLVPNLVGYSALSFTSGARMYDIGYKCAIEKIPQILSDLQKLKKKK